jgi:hypothetical protein
MPSHRLGIAVLAVLAAAPVTPAPAGAQAGPALVGAGVGFLGGGVATLSLVVGRARWESEYIGGAADLVGLNGAPVVIGTATGVAIGLWDEDRLRQAVIGGGGGMVLGIGTGWVAGTILGDRRADKWAGAVIGAGIGLAAGALVGALLPPDGEPGDGEGAVAALRRPEGIRVGFRVPSR